MTKPTIGRIVLYTLSDIDAQQINRRRQHAKDSIEFHRENANGVQVHIGNNVAEGEVFPMIVTRTWGDQPDSYVNGQVMLDGNDLFWVTSVKVGDGPRTFAWPVRP